MGSGDRQSSGTFFGSPRRRIGAAGAPTIPRDRFLGLHWYFVALTSTTTRRPLSLLTGIHVCPVRTWNRATAQMVRMFVGHSARVRTLQVQYDLIFSGADDREVSPLPWSLCVCLCLCIIVCFCVCFSVSGTPHDSHRCACGACTPANASAS